ncbi:MAG: CoA pyrophosphatase [Planctomycetes bacterium]|nr:CoA pyrophosphatase [Planctomycetota bacterium]
MPETGGGERDLEFAVLIPILDHRGEEAVLLTERNARLPQYAGQVSFPGGARDPGDASLRQTVLRETLEEIGVPTQNISIFAELEWYRPRLGHRVKPFAGRLIGSFQVSANPREVARLIYLPVAVVKSDPFQVRGQFQDGEGKTHMVYTFLFEGAEIWGLTARILRRFFVEGVIGENQNAPGLRWPRSSDTPPGARSRGPGSRPQPPP